MPLSLLSAAALATLAAPQFASPVDVTNGVEGAVFATAFDLELDGDDDLIVAAGSRLVVFERTGPNQFAEPFDLETDGGALARLVIGDLTGDGLDDLVAFESGQGEVRVYAARPTGGLEPGELVLTVGPQAHGLEVGDVAPDGLLDVLVALETGGMRCYRNLGALQFGAPLPVGPDTTQVLDFEVADLNDDGNPDVIFGADIADRIGWLPGNGNGTFANERFVANALEDPRDVDLADLDGDGDLDAFVAWEGEGRVDWYENIDIGLYFGRGPLVSGLERPTSIEAGDFDQDGDVDLFVHSLGARGVSMEQRVDWIESDTVGTYLPPVPVLTGLEGSVVLVPADLDDDLQADVVTASPLGELLRLPGLGAGAVPRFGSPVEITRLVVDPSELIAADINADGIADLVVAEPSIDRVSWIERNTDGSLGMRRTIDGVARSVGKIQVVDLNQDGALDLVSAHLEGNQLAITMASSPGVFLPTQVVESFAASVGAVTVGPLDGDTLDDLVVALDDDNIFWFRNLGGGAFGTRQLVGSVSGNVREVQVIDVDGDGATDVVQVLETAGRMEWVRNLGGAVFAAPLDIAGLAQGIVDGQLVDLNGDDDVDAIWLLGDAGEVGIAINFGGGAFGPPSLAGTLSDVAATLDVVDLDGDQDLDLVATLEPAPGVIALQFAENLGLATFAGFQDGPLGVLSTGRPAFEDAGADGDLDLLLPRTAASRLSSVENRFINFIGDSFCTPGVPNATGLDGRISVLGSERVVDNDVLLRADRLPPSSFGFFFTSMTSMAPAMVPGGQGLLCLGGSIGRYVGPGFILTADATGRVELPIDLGTMPQPAGPVAAVAGETWNFQLWHRDQVGGVATSNFTDAIAVAFE